MEKQNDHKKFSKKIWVLSAGIIVILAIVLFAGIKNGFFLRKGDKILYAAYHTIKDQPETADVSKDEDLHRFDGRTMERAENPGRICIRFRSETVKGNDRFR